MDELDDVFRAPAHPARRAIVDRLVLLESAPGPPVESGEIADLLWDSHRLMWPSVSKHLGVLARAGLVESRVDAQSRLYTVRRAGFAELTDWAAWIVG